MVPLCLVMSSCTAEEKKPDAPIVAKVATTPFVIADMPTTITTDGSTLPTNVKLSYTYDVDGDGEFETIPGEGYQGSLSHVFTETGPHKVGVKIDDETGQSSTASVEFTVYPSDYLSADKKSELKATVSEIGGKAIIQTQTQDTAKISLRVYLKGTDHNTAKPADIKVYGPWEAVGGATVTHEVDVSELSPGKYNGTIASDSGPEKNVSFSIK